MNPLGDSLTRTAVNAGRVLQKAKLKGVSTRLFGFVSRFGSESTPAAVFAKGDAAFRLGRWDEALEATQQAIAATPAPPRRWLLREGDVMARQGRKGEAAEYFAQLAERQPDDAAFARRAAKAFASAGRSADGANLLHQRVIENPDALPLWRDYVNFVRVSAPMWQRVDVLTQAVERFPERSDWFAYLGLAQVGLEHWEEATASFTRAVRGGSKNKRAAGWYAALAPKWAPSEAAAALDYADQLQPELGFKEFGPGVFFAARGLWPEALEAYETKIAEGVPNPELAYKAGVAADRVLDWARAEEHLRRAVSAPAAPRGWYSRLGLALERQEKWANAAEAYARAIALAPDDHEYDSYRLGTVLSAGGDPALALEAYRGMHGVDPFRDGVDAWELAKEGLKGRLVQLKHTVTGAPGVTTARPYREAMAQLRAGRHAAALESLESAVAQDPEQNPRGYFLLGCGYAAAGRRDEALAAFAQAKDFGRPHGVAANRYLNARWKYVQSRYVEFQETLPLEATVVYESFFGNKVDDNPLAIYRALRSRLEGENLLHVWVVGPDAGVPADVAADERVLVVRRDSILYAKHLATASYLVNNVTFPSWFVRRDGQSYLNTWHGTPLKTLGKDIGTGLMEHANVARNFLHASVLLAPNDHTEYVLTQRYEIQGLMEATVGRTGTPRSDEMVRMTPEQASEHRARLGIRPGATVVFYAPTWRGALNESRSDEEQLLADLEVMRERGDVHVIFRAHHFSEALLAGKDLGVTVLPSDMSTAVALGITDVLITDYSSIFFDFLPLRRPVIYYVYDLEEYTAERGMYYGITEMPGDVALDREQLREAIGRAVEHGISDPDAHQAAIERFAPYEDGHASERAVELLLGERAGSALEPAPLTPVLFHQSMLPNGITSSFLNLVHHLDPERYRVVFLFDPASVQNDPMRRERLDQLPDHVQRIGRVGGHLLSLQERWAVPRFGEWKDFPTPEYERVYRRAFAREARRVFGSARFATAVEFDGYAAFWSALLAADSELAQRRVMYFHNRIFAELTTKYPELACNLRVAAWFQSLVSVSSATNDINREELAEPFSLDPAEFSYAENMLDVERMVRLAAEEPDDDIAAFLAPASRAWLTIGRMSPEKGHLKLFEAFREHLAQGHPDERLVVLGMGPLRAELEDWIAREGLGERIFLAGQRSNPFSVMRLCEAFVLASDHEGQPMVLLEALTLGLRVMATDIVGSRSVIGDGTGLLVENSVDGVREGLAALPTFVPSAHFDVNEYQARALAQALSAIDPEGAAL